MVAMSRADSSPYLDFHRRDWRERRATMPQVLTEEELTTRLRESKEELFNLRFQAATGQMEKTHRVGEVRKDIARISTLLREKRSAS